MIKFIYSCQEKDIDIIKVKVEVGGNMMNDRLERIQVGREDDVPIEQLNIWYLLIKNDGTWDAGQFNEDCFPQALKEKNTKHVFAVWHGQYKTNLFLMDKEKLFKKFKKLGYKCFK